LFFYDSYVRVTGTNYLQINLLYRNGNEPSHIADEAAAENIPGLGNRSATPDRSSRCSSAAGLPLAAWGGCSSPEYRVTSDESRSASRLSKDADAASISSDDAGKFDAGDDDDNVDSVDV
jgi:hypothetical protein